MSLDAGAHAERDLTAQQIDLAALALVERSRLRDADQLERRVERAGLVLGLCRGKGTPSAA